MTVTGVMATTKVLTHSLACLLLTHSLTILGYGKLRNKDGDLYVGEFHVNKFNTSKSDAGFIAATPMPDTVDRTRYTDKNAVAIHQYAYGSVYKGSLHSLTHSFIHVLTYSCNQFLFEGAMKDGVYSGRGTYIYSNGTVYDGYWSQGKRKTVDIVDVIKRCVLTDMSSDAVLYEGSWSHHWHGQFPQTMRCKLIDIDNKVSTHYCIPYSLTHSLTHLF